MTVGERIKQRRLDLGLSQDELAKKVGYKSRFSINKIELSRDLPLRKVKEMARVLDTTPGYLMGWDNEEPQVIVKEKNDYIDENKEIKMLLEAAKGSTPEHIELAADLLNRLKNEK